jgi:hypothetical protein
MSGTLLFMTTAIAIMIGVTVFAEVGGVLICQILEPRVTKTV